MYNYTHWGLNTLSGRDNMALEELFLRRSAEDNSAHIRFYDFAKDTVVVGYAQDLDAVKQTSSRFDVIRRPSGGSHVHVGDNILAYSFIVPRDGSFRSHSDFRAYYAELVGKSLEQMGLNVTVDNDACTVMANDKVIASHAITWGVQSALLHGLIMIDAYDMKRLVERIHLATRKIGSESYSEISALHRIPTVAGLLTAKPHATSQQRNRYFKEILCGRILHNVAGKHSNSFITDDVLARARKMLHQKYSNEAWIQSRKPAFTEEEVELIPGETLDGPLKKGLGYCLYSQVKDKEFKKMSEPGEFTGDM